ncbi:hypothetical protein [Nostoc sp.]
MLIAIDNLLFYQRLFTSNNQQYIKSAADHLGETLNTIHHAFAIHN